MKFAVILPVDEIHPEGEFYGSEALAAMGAAVERSAFDGACVSDHPAPTGRWLDHGGHFAQDPFVSLTYLAAVTKRIKLVTSILVLPYRNPLVVARAVNSLQALSHGRFVLGCGAGYLKGEFFAVGADFERRNDVMDDYLAALKAAWSDDEFSHDGDGYSARGIRILPRPKTPPPIWIGGNSRRAIRRAAEFGDAWSPFNATPLVAGTARTAVIGGEEGLTESLAYLRAHAEKIGKPPPKDIVFDGFRSPTEDSSPQALIDYAGTLTDLGVTRANVHIPGATRAEWIENMERYSAQVAAKLDG